MTISNSNFLLILRNNSLIFGFYFREKVALALYIDHEEIRMATQGFNV